MQKHAALYCRLSVDDVSFGGSVSMRQMNVYPVTSVVKIGDTIADILEGKNAGAWSIGILTGSNLLGLTQEEYTSMHPDQLAQKKTETAKKYMEAGADMVIDSIRELPEAITALNMRMTGIGK